MTVARQNLLNTDTRFSRDDRSFPAQLPHLFTVARLPLSNNRMPKSCRSQVSARIIRPRAVLAMADGAYGAFTGGWQTVDLLVSGGVFLHRTLRGSG